jgi:LCP family protein required for cell wall assembly
MVEGAGQQQRKAPKLRHRKPNRVPQIVVVTINVFLALCCFAGAAGLIIGQRFLNDTLKTDAIASPSTTTTRPPRPGGSTDDTSSPGTNDSGAPQPTAAPEDFPVANPDARNFLVTGADNNACDDDDEEIPVGQRPAGERSDTIMVMRVDPSNDRAAILSFPRDLRVKIAGTNSKNKINSAYSMNDPQRLVDTIYLNFGIKIDHYIQIDFCAFKVLVDAVGGVAVPFPYAVRDLKNTGLDIPQPGCATLDGHHALQYVRSRHLRYLDPATNTYKEDLSADYGRIARQQDFLRRAVSKVLSQGFDIGVARSLIEVATKYVVTDPELTVRKQLEFAGVLRDIEPADIVTYRVEGTGKLVSGTSFIEPNLGTSNMKGILAIFRGEAELPSATSTTAAASNVRATGSAAESPAAATTATTATATTATTAQPTAQTTATTATTGGATPATATIDQPISGIVPPADVFCE